MRVSVKRGDSYQEFEVPRQPSQTVLDVVTYIQRVLDATLAYRLPAASACAARAP